MSQAMVLDGRRTALHADLRGAARTLSVVTLVGAVSGMLVVGVLARLAMMLLAVLNPDAAGVTSDDGFAIGQFTLAGSLQLMFAGLQFGILGAGFYVALRGLMVGPPWFRLASISLGPAVVVGAIVVHTDGVDFTLLDPVVLAVALFLAVPACFVALLHLLAERALQPDRDLPRLLLVLGLLPWLVLLPLTLALAGGFLAVRRLRTATVGRTALVRAALPWALRGALAVLVVFALIDLGNDLAFLTAK